MFAGGSLRRGRGLWAVLVVGLILGWVAGCTQLGSLLPGGNADPARTVDDASLGINPSDDGTTASSCGLNMLVGADHDAAIQAATNNPKVQNIQQEFSTRGFTVQANGALAFSIDSEKLVYLPAGDTAGIVAETYLGQWYAVGLVKEGDKTTNIRPDRGVHHLTGFDPKTRAKLFKSLRNTSQVKNLEKTLKKQNQLIDWNKSVLIVDTENNQATVGFAIRATDNSKPAWFGYRVDATLLKGDKLSVQNIKAETCGALATAAPIAVQSSGGAKPQFCDGCEPDPGGSYSQTQVCVSSWGYNYYCFNSTPQFGVSAVSSPLAAFVNTSLQTTFTIWNYSNTTMSGTATTAAPFSIVSGGSFSLAAGQPQPVTVQFNPTTSGNYSGNIALTSGSLVQNVAISAYTLTITPARLDYTTFIGGSQNQTLNVRNDGPLTDTGLNSTVGNSSVTVTLSTSAPYSIVGSSSVTINNQASSLVTIGYAPSGAGSFPASVHLTSGSSSTDLPLGGTTYQVSLNPSQPNVATFVSNPRQLTVALTNTGTVPVTITPSMTAPFSVVSPTSAVTLQANQGQNLTLQFSPTASGTFSGSLHLAASGSATKDFPISGTAYQVSLSPTSLSFTGFVGSGGPADQNVIVTNAGTNALSLTPSTSAPFSVTSPTGSVTVAPGQNQQITVHFNPTASGSFTGNLHLAMGSTGLDVPISGAAHQLAINLQQLNLVALVGGSADQPLIVTNTGTTTFSLTATTAGSFSIVSGGTLSLSPGQSQQITVRFSPTTSGNMTGTVLLGLTGSASSLSVPVAGTAHQVSVSPSTLTYPGLIFVSNSMDQPVSVTNTGTTTFSLTASTSAPFSVVSPTSSVTLAPNQSVVVTVRFAPTAGGAFLGSLHLVADSLPLDVALEAWTLSVSPAQLNFTDAFVGYSPKTQVFTVRNDAPATWYDAGGKAIQASVNMNVSASAPFSTLPTTTDASFTLTGGQSRTVTIQFNPTDSGTFTSNIGLSANLGALVSSTLQLSATAVAHNVTFDQVQLFFLKLIQGSVVSGTIDLQLVVNNQGTTTFTLTPNTGTPFSIVSPTNSFTLPPNQNQVVTVRFSPTAFGTSHGSLSFALSQADMVIPLTGVTMNYDDYIKAVMGAYNIMTQNGSYGTMFAEDTHGRAIFFGGFKNLNTDMVHGFLDDFDQVDSLPSPGDNLSPAAAQALAILQTISPQQMQDWLWTLVVAERAGQFDQAYAQLLTQGFNNYVQAVELLKGISADQVQSDTHQFVQQLASTNGQSLIETLQELPTGGGQGGTTDPIFEALKAVFLAAFTSNEDLNNFLAILGSFATDNPLIGFLIGLAPTKAAELLATAFETALNTAAAVQGIIEPEIFKTIMNVLLQHLKSRTGEDPVKIATLLAKVWFVMLDVANPFSSTRFASLALLTTAEISVEIYGWKLMDVKTKIMGKDGKVHTIDLTLTKVGFFLDKSGKVVNALSLINFYDCGGTCTKVDFNHIFSDLQAIMANLSNLLAQNGADFAIIGLVILGGNSFSPADLQALENQIQQNYGNSDAAIFLIYEDSNGNLFYKCFGQGCNDMSDTLQKVEACRQAGLLPNCVIHKG